MDKTHECGDQDITPGLISMAEAQTIFERIDRDLRFADRPPQPLISSVCDEVETSSGEGGAAKSC